MNSILGKLKLGVRENRESRETTFMMRNGATLLKELIASSNGKYNPYRIFSTEELQIATNNFNKENIIIHEFTYKFLLYKGFWQEHLISVMKFRKYSDQVFGYCMNNIVYASQMSRKHILKLIGCCLETENPILVFEYVHYGTLADRIFGSPQPQFQPLLLTQRLKIAMDIAHAVAYLHLGFPRPIIFRDFKTSNILFNEENVAKLFDFSSSISIPEGETHVHDELRGTSGFISPEYLRTGDFNEKLDVFSFGVFLAELLTGQRAIDFDRSEYDEDVLLMDRVNNCFEENRIIEIVDSILVEDWSCPGKEHQLQAFAQLMIECVNGSPVDRPTMVDVAKRLRQMYRSYI